MYSEFEYYAHSLVEKGEPISKDLLNKKYKELNIKYYGKDVKLPKEDIGETWERIPHFYRAYYVYKYATGLSAACYIVNRILSGEENAVNDYINFLKCGKSKSPLDSLLVAGVDLSDSKVIEEAIKMFDDTIEEFKKLYSEVYGK